MVREALTCDGLRWERLGAPAQIVTAEHDLGGECVLLQAAHLVRAGNRHDVVTLRQDSGQSQLGEGHFLDRRQFLQPLQHRQVSRQVRFLESGIAATARNRGRAGTARTDFDCEPSTRGSRNDGGRYL